jgi:hypothetical protein
MQGWIAASLISGQRSEAAGIARKKGRGSPRTSTLHASHRGVYTCCHMEETTLHDAASDPIVRGLDGWKGSIR